MTTTELFAGAISEADHGRQLRRAIIASTVGTTIEWYDFLLYSVVTGLVFGKLFFPESDPLVGVLQAFAVYTVGFIARPIGAAIFGHYGDRIGRKAALIATLLITGLATFVVGLVPGYDNDRHLGCRDPDDHPLYPGDRGRRRMGRLGAAGDGMGAHQQASRVHHVLAAIRRAGGVAAGQSGGAGVQRDFRRPVPGLGLAHPVPAQHRHGRCRALHPARHPRDADLPAPRRGGSDRTGAGPRSDQAPTQTGHPGGARAHGRAGPGLHLSRLCLCLRDAGSAHVARFSADGADCSGAGFVCHDPARRAFVGSVRPQAHISDRLRRHRDIRLHLLRDAEHGGARLDVSRDRAVLCPARPDVRSAGGVDRRMLYCRGCATAAPRSAISSPR